MTEQIIPRASIRAKARAAFDRGLSRDSHCMNPGSPALFDWLEEYDRCAAQMTHLATPSRVRFDARQVAA